MYIHNDNYNNTIICIVGSVRCDCLPSGWVILPDLDPNSCKIIFIQQVDLKLDYSIESSFVIEKAGKNLYIVIQWRKI